VTHFPVDAPKVKVIKTFELLGSKADLLTLIKRMVQLYLDSRNPTTPGSCNG